LEPQAASPVSLRLCRLSEAVVRRTRRDGRRGGVWTARPPAVSDADADARHTMNLVTM
jgi:hypothetical protein